MQKSEELKIEISLLFRKYRNLVPSLEAFLLVRSGQYDTFLFCDTLEKFYKYFSTCVFLFIKTEKFYLKI